MSIKEWIEGYFIEIAVPDEIKELLYKAIVERIDILQGREHLRFEGECPYPESACGGVYEQIRNVLPGLAKELGFDAAPGMRDYLERLRAENRRLLNEEAK